MKSGTLLNVDKLWEEYSKNRDPEIKNQLLIHYVDLVKRIVRRIMPKYREYNDSDDLVSCGVIGLIDALEKYDINYGVKFETYASTRIRGEILDYMRKQDWAPASLRSKINRINSSIEYLESLLGRYPTDSEIAENTGMSVSEVRKVLEKTHMFNLMHFEDMVSDNISLVKASEAADNDPEAVMQNKETKRILAEIIESLPEKEKLVITLYYYEEMTLKEIASVLKVTESRVSQIHSKVLVRIGNKFNRAV
ncbi:MAG: sigma-70 family RNA polymerase sigma factor [Oscillospiraceae bacterium]|jgi:RNA polymerase sigma factor for flagellar operon FliA